MRGINPTTEQPLTDYPELDDAQVEQRLEQAEAAFRQWRDVAFAERAEKMRTLAAALRDQKPRLAGVMTDEMGKPITQAEGEIEKCAWVCEHYAEHAESYLAERMIETDATRSYVRHDPIGPVLAIMPWNFPYWQVFRFAAPGVMAGNVGLLKHASNVPGCATAIEELFHQSGFPPGVFTALMIPTSKVDDVIAHSAVRAVTLTGSERAGKSVAAQAGKHIKKSVLELGGSDPMLVLADADPQQAAELACKSRTINAGQSCIAAKRFLVEEPIADRFEEALIAQMESLKIGDPRDRETQIGPLAREDLLIDLHDQVQKSIHDGAELRLGGQRINRDGYFYAPTVLTGVRPGMVAFEEETFGPLAAVTRGGSAEELVELANRSTFGLGACIVTPDTDRAAKLAAKIESGCVFVNEMVKSDPRVPFGGVKRSGYGRELAGVGIREFVNIKTVWIQ